MEFRVIIILACMTITLGASVFCLILYLNMFMKRTNVSMGMVGILNLLIGGTMALTAIMASPIPSGQQSTSFIRPATSVTLLFVGLFILGQFIYLVSSHSPLRRQVPQTQEPEQSTKQVDESPDTEHIDQELRDRLQADNSIRLMQILDMSYPLVTADMYVPIKVLTQNGQISEDDDEQDNGEIRSPEARLEREQEQLRDRLKYAQDPIEIITRENWKHCVILGEPGIGKTTFLHYLALQVVKREVPAFQEVTPIYVVLNDFLAKPTNAGEEETLLKFIVSYYRSNYNIDIKSLLKERCQSGKILLLLDGLDETFGGETRAEAMQNYQIVHTAIGAVASQYKDMRILVTSRKASYDIHRELADVNGEPFKRLEIPGFSEENIQSFVKRLLNSYQQRYNIPPSELPPAGLLQILLQREPRLRDLSRLPLLLAMITLIYCRKWDVSSHRAEIYKECVNILLKRRDKSFEFGEEIDPDGTDRYNEFKADEKYKLLKEIGTYLHEQKVYKLNRNNVFGFVQSSLHKTEEYAQRMINEIMMGSGLLVQASNDTYKFSHEIFQEYFAAQSLIPEQMEQEKDEQEKNRQLIALLDRYQRDPWWEGVILLYAAYSNIRDMVKILRTREREDFFRTNLLLAGRYMATTLTLSDAVQDAIDQLFSLLETEESAVYELQREVVMILAEIARQDSEVQLGISKKLIEIVKDQRRQRQIRQFISRVLGKWGNSEFIRQCLHMLLRHSSQPEIDEDMLSYVVLSLAQWNDSALAKQLVPLLAEPIGLKMRRYIAFTIGFLGRGGTEKKDEDTASVADDLIEYLENLANNDFSLRLDVIQSLRRLEDPSVIRQLLELLRAPSHFIRDDVYDNECTQIIYALGSLVPLSPIEQDRKDAVSALFNILEEHPDGRGLAHVSIIVLGCWLKFASLYDLVIPKLQKLRQKKQLSSWLSGRLSVLFAIFGPDKNGQSGLFDPRKLFSGNGDAEDLVAFLQGLNLDLPDRSEQATRFFEALAPLVFERKIDSIVRSRLAQTLGELGDKGVAKIFLAQFLNEDVDNAVLTEVIQAIYTLYDKDKMQARDATEPLYDLLSRVLERGSNESILISLAEALEMMTHRADTALEDTRKRAIEMLRNSEHRKKALTGVGKYYTVALGYLGDETVLGDLVELLLDQTLINDVQDHDLRKRVAYVLGRFSRRTDQKVTEQWKGIVKDLEELLEHRLLGRQVRNSIVEALQLIARNVRPDMLVDDQKMSLQICKELVKHIDDSAISGRVYTAVKAVSIQRGFRVTNPKDDSGIRVELLEEIRTSPSV